MPCHAPHRTAPHRTAHRFHPAPLASQVHRQVASRRAECLRHGHIPSQRCQPAVPVQCPCGGCPGRIRKAGRVKQGWLLYLVHLFARCYDWDLETSPLSRDLLAPDPPIHSLLRWPTSRCTSRQNRTDRVALTTGILYHQVHHKRPLPGPSAPTVK